MSAGRPVSTRQPRPSQRARPPCSPTQMPPSLPASRARTFCDGRPSAIAVAAFAPGGRCASPREVPIHSAPPASSSNAWVRPPGTPAPTGCSPPSRTRARPWLAEPIQTLPSLRSVTLSTLPLARPADPMASSMRWPSKLIRPSEVAIHRRPSRDRARPRTSAEWATLGQSMCAYCSNRNPGSSAPAGLALPASARRTVAPTRPLHSVRRQARDPEAITAAMIAERTRRANGQNPSLEVSEPDHETGAGRGTAVPC